MSRPGALVAHFATPLLLVLCLCLVVHVGACGAFCNAAAVSPLSLLGGPRGCWGAGAVSEQCTHTPHIHTRTHACVHTHTQHTRPL